MSRTQFYNLINNSFSKFVFLPEARMLKLQFYVVVWSIARKEKSKDQEKVNVIFYWKWWFLRMIKKCKLLNRKSFEVILFDFWSSESSTSLPGGNQVDGLPPASSTDAAAASWHFLTLMENLFFACLELNFIIWLTIHFRNAYFFPVGNCSSFNLMWLFDRLKEKKNVKTIERTTSFFIENHILQFSEKK